MIEYFNELYAYENSAIHNDLIRRVIPTLVTDANNAALTSLPSLTEVCNAVFSSNGDSKYNLRKI